MENRDRTDRELLVLTADRVEGPTTAFRSFRHTTQDKIVDRVDGSGDDTFGTPHATALTEVAAAYGIPEGELEVIVSPTKPDVAGAITGTPAARAPDPEPPLTDDELVRLRALI